MTAWEADYIAIRKKEGFLFTDEEVKNLPYRPTSDTNYLKWCVRQKSTDRILNYLSRRLTDKVVLDLGCGNGWFSGRIARLHPNTTISSWDVNHTELAQAKRVFQFKNLTFHFQDIFDESITQTFDVILLNSVIQYFPDATLLLRRLKQLLNPLGEIHIIDSPFYTAMELDAARVRSRQYYENLGLPHMAEHYHHHSLDIIKDHNAEIMYNANSLYNKIRRKIGLIDSPFLWLKIAPVNSNSSGIKTNDIQ